MVSAVVAVVALAGILVSVGAFSLEWQLDLEVDMVLRMVAQRLGLVGWQLGKSL